MLSIPRRGGVVPGRRHHQQPREARRAVAAAAPRARSTHGPGGQRQREEAHVCSYSFTSVCSFGTSPTIPSAYLVKDARLQSEKSEKYKPRLLHDRMTKVPSNAVGYFVSVSSLKDGPDVLLDFVYLPLGLSMYNY